LVVRRSLVQLATGQAFAADYRLRTLALTRGEIAGDAFQLLLRDEWSDLGCRIQSVAYFEAAAKLAHSTDELVIDPPFDEQPRARAANLSRVGKHRHGRTPAQAHCLH
jgi:hypothetical protein